MMISKVFKAQIVIDTSVNLLRSFELKSSRENVASDGAYSSLVSGQVEVDVRRR